MTTITMVSKKAKAQNMQGYRVHGDTTTFIFDEKIYNLNKVTRVSVTGLFRGWDQSMEDTDWLLENEGNRIWTLSIKNESFEVISPQTEFKFRINEGVWVHPPAKSRNARNGNLVFLHDTILPTLKAEILSDHAIWAKTTGIPRPLGNHHYVLKDAIGKEIPIASVLPNTESETLIIPALKIDRKRIYWLEIPGYGLRSWCSFDGWFKTLYSHKELGANISDDGKSTTFRIFSPRAELVKLYLYDEADSEEPGETIEMVSDENQVWEASIPKNLKGIYYDFTVHGSTDKGNHFYETLPKHISDPYARVNTESWGRSMVWEKTTPATPLEDGIPCMEDVIAYEVHVQDFTDLLPVAEDLKGTLPAMHIKGLKNSKGDPIGFDHLRKLGINTLHLMPVQEFMHQPDDIWKESFQDDPYMIAQGIHEENYQWGYRTSHCFAVENKYRDRTTKPGEERNQLRDLVQAYHDEGIAVIIDIVPNHTAEDMDGHWYFHFNVLDKLYYYRTKDLDHIGEYGNEVKTENRPMVQKWLIDQCLHFINEFGIDGFRVDLAGQIDKQTLKKLKDEIGHDKILYGEPWIASNDPEFESNPDWDWYKHDSPITFFQDDARTAFKGPVFDLKNPARDRGYAGGNLDEREAVCRGLANRNPDDKRTTSGINYLDIHDNWALADQFAIKDWDGRKGVDEDRFKIAATYLFTSMGPIVLHGGTEFMRSKGHAPLEEVKKTMSNGVTMYWHGKRDTYNCRTANQFRWEGISNAGTPEDPRNQIGMLEFWQGLIALRKSDIGEIFREDFKTPNAYYRFFTPWDRALLGYMVAEQIVVFTNVGEGEKTFRNIQLPEGRYVVIGNNNHINHHGIRPYQYIEVENGRSLDIRLPGKGILIWKKEKE